MPNPQFTEPTFVGALRLHLIPLTDKKLRLEYHANNPENPNALPTGEPVFFEEIEWEEGMNKWVSQLVVGDMANVMGSGFFVDEKNLRHFRATVDPGVYQSMGADLGG